jgi:hypothetical protein
VVGAHRADEAGAVITLGFVVAIGLPLVVLVLAIILPDHRDKP